MSGKKEQPAAIPPVQDPTDALEEWGTVITSDRNLSKLPRCYGRDPEVARIVKQLTHGDHRSIVLDGDRGVGKTAIVYEVAHELAKQGWHMLEVQPTALLVGTYYLGEWQTRVNKLLESVKQPARIALFVPNFDKLSTIGKSENQDSSAADLFMPLMSTGQLAIVGEGVAGEEGSAWMLRKHAETIEIMPMSQSQTLDIANHLLAGESFSFDDGVTDRLLELSEFCGHEFELPGRVISLVRECLDKRKKDQEEISTEEPSKEPFSRKLSVSHLLQAVSDKTGIRTTLLDDTTLLDRDSIRSFFESRVLGQTEAIEVATDIVMMIKAGLTDPNKPFCTMLFIGPTGVGKTEMARAIAEYCLNDAQRVVRLDMSEYMTVDTNWRLLGNKRQSGALTGPIRERPFSVILLDEFEKSNYAVFDLCLQLFDAGRLTDLSNRTVSFRRTIIILTSNLGSRIDTPSKSSQLGFGKTLDTEEESLASRARQSAQNALHAVFRPEFINRLDRVVHFVPLNRDTIEQIARRELERALDRSGITRRKLKIQVDPSIYHVLSDSGFSPAFGARPLKRTIEKMVVIPLARDIASGKIPIGSTIRIALRGGKIRLRPVKTDLEQDSVSVDTLQPSRRSISENQTLQELLKTAGELEGKTKELRARKSSLLGRLNSPEKLAKEERLSAFDEVYQLDSILARYETFASQLAQVSEVQSTKNIGSLTPIPKEKLNGLVAQSKILCRLLQAEDALDSKDVILTISLVESVGNRLGIVEKLARMYQVFLERMGYKLQCVDDQLGDKPIIDRICFLVSGPGAWTALQQEQGLHVFRKGNDENKQRETASVDLVSLDAEAGEAFAKECSFRTQRTKGSMRLSGKSRVKFELAHRGTNTALSVAFDSSPNEARVLLLPWLETLARNQSNLERDNSADDQTMKETVVRRYDLGPSGLVRDTASGQRSGHVDKVLAGELERCIPWMQ